MSARRAALAALGGMIIEDELETPAPEQKRAAVPIVEPPTSSQADSELMTLVYLQPSVDEILAEQEAQETGSQPAPDIQAQQFKRSLAYDKHRLVNCFANQSPELRGAMGRARTILAMAQRLVDALERAELFESATDIGLRMTGESRTRHQRFHDIAINEANRRLAELRGQDPKTMLEIAVISAVTDAAESIELCGLDDGDRFERLTIESLLAHNGDHLLTVWPELTTPTHPSPAPGTTFAGSFRRAVFAWKDSPKVGPGATSWNAMVDLLVLLGVMSEPKPGRPREAVRKSVKMVWRRWLKRTEHLRNRHIRSVDTGTRS